ncbi:MAG: VIT1/CCC1 transporter family protein [Patescibacteria group bacterium]
MSENIRAARYRNFVFGVEDSLVSTVGLLSGIAIAGIPRTEIFLTGIVLIFVEAFSMGAGSFLSESSAEELTTHRRRSSKNPSVNAVVMFFSYFIFGFIPLFPYFLFTIERAFFISVSASIVTLFILGAVGGKASHINPWRSALRMAVVGGIAILVGIGVGQLAS